jgi:Flp pilus assembly pilin Flp
MGWTYRALCALRTDRGAALIEWALLVVLIAVVALIALTVVGEKNSAMWSQVASSLG